MKKQKLANVSPWIFAAACTLLTLIIGVFAVNNYHREKKLMSEALLQQGITIVRFVMSSSRSSLRGNLRNIHVAMWQWTDHVQQAIDNTKDQPGMRFLCLVDQNGKILASSEAEKNGTIIDDSTLEFLNTLKEGENIDGSYRIKPGKGESGPVFQVAARYFPLGFRNFIPKMNRRGILPQRFSEEVRMQGRANNRQWIEHMKELASMKHALLVELDLSQFNKAVRSQLLQIIFLSLVLLLVGIGGWLSLLTLQGLKGSQIRLSRITQFTDMLISSLPVGLVATDNDGNIRLYNHSAEDIIGISRDNVIGRDPSRVLPIELLHVLNNSGTGGTAIHQTEITFADKTGKNRSLMLASLPVVDKENRFVGNTLLLQDISHIKELESEVRRNERLAALGKMAAGLAHELRNPLSSIKGLAILLKTRLKQDKQGKDTADVLVQEVERLDRSIGELLDYARPQKLNLEVVDLKEILNKAVTLIRIDAEAAGVKINTDFSQNNLYVWGDKDKLAQVFLNLLINSIQAMENGGELGVFTNVDGAKIICTIEDNGCGLDQENVPRVFDPYFTTKNDGTGLGLAMSAKIVEEHSGIIEFRSKPGEGTTVKVCLESYSGGR